MAKVIPDGWRELSATGAAAGELETLRVLADGLPDTYTIYHGVHWTRIEKHNFAIYGEIDYAIVGPSGKLLLIEKKAGILTESAEGLLKGYAEKEKSVPFQMARNADALHSRLRQLCGADKTFVDSLLFCPHYKVKNPGSAGIDPSRIVDASKADRLIPIIQSILPAEDEVLAAKSKVHRFLGDLLEIVPDVHAIVGDAGALYTRLSGGLSEWGRKIDCEPFRLRVTGTAGSGKTQLAMAVYRDAIKAGRRPFYVCYNRPLADHISTIAPDGGQVTNYHQLGTRICHNFKRPADFRKPDAFAHIEKELDQYQPTPAELFDELIVDEGQDFREGWIENLLRFLKPGGRAWWLEDPMQNLYGREPIPLPGWVRLRSDINYRSPKDILQTINRLLPLQHPLESGCPLTGSEVEFLTYTDTKDLIAKTMTALTKCIGDGFKRSHISLVTFRGREHSKIAPFDTLGPYSLRAPTGKYDLFGNPVFTEGDVLTDSVYRFKGRASPCVVFTEIDFETLDDNVVRRLFVGATRATMKLVMVMSENSAKVLLERLAD